MQKKTKKLGREDNPKQEKQNVPTTQRKQKKTTKKKTQQHKKLPSYTCQLLD